MAEFTQQQLEQLVVGKAPRPRAVFFEKATLNHAKSFESGHRVYDRSVFIKVSHPGVTDWVAYLAQPADFKEYAEEYKTFLGNRQGQRKPAIDIIPNLDIIHYQELIDMGLLTVEALAETITVPPHLEYARQIAIKLNSVIKETDSGNEETIERHGTGADRGEVADLFTAHRPEHPAGDGRPAVRASDLPRDVEGPSRVRASRRVDGGQSIDNWEVHFGA